MIIFVIFLLLLSSNAYYLTPFKVTNQKFNDETIKVYEPLELEKNKNILFFTGANSFIPGEVYSSFLTNIAQYNMSIYVCSNNVETSNYIVKDLDVNNETIVLGHSTGCVNALDFCNQNENVKNIIMMDPVDNSFLYRRKYNNFPTRFKNNIAKRFVETIKTIPVFDRINYEEEEEIKTELDFQHIEKALFLNARKSYTWDLFDKKFPFIPAFSITPEKITFNKTVNSLIMTANDFGHTDILDEIWANNMHNTVSRGSNDRSSDNLNLYHKWLATVIYIFVNHNEDIKEALKSSETIEKIKYHFD